MPKTKQDYLYTLIESAVSNVTDRNLKDERFKENRLNDFKNASNIVIEHKRRLALSSKVEPEDLTVYYSYKSSL